MQHQNRKLPRDAIPWRRVGQTFTSYVEYHVDLVMILQRLRGDPGRVHDHGVAELPVGDGLRVRLHEALEADVGALGRPHQLVRDVHLRGDCAREETPVISLLLHSSEAGLLILGLV